MPSIAVLVSNDLNGDSRVQKLIGTFVSSEMQTYALVRRTKRDSISITGAEVRRISFEQSQLDRLGPSLNMDRSYRLRSFALRVKRNLHVMKQEDGMSYKLFIKYVIHYLRQAVGFLHGFKDNSIQKLNDSPAVDRLRNIEFGYVRELNTIHPDIIYANDYDTLGAAVLYAETQDVRPVIIYDSHEYIAGVKRGNGDEIAVATAYQGKFIEKIDGLISVSSEVIEKLIDDYGLKVDSQVVLNAPELKQLENCHRGTLRAEAGVSDEPLHVYVGAIAPQRGVETAIEALKFLPTHHLAVVCLPDHPYVQVLKSFAFEHGVVARVHFVDYVPANYVSRYISDATSGLIPILHFPNHEMQLITKYFEYMHAGIPIVTSDVREMSHYTKIHRIGEVFLAEDVADCARALRQVVEHNASYRENLTEDLLKLNSWDNQAAQLVAFIDELRVNKNG